MPVVTCYDMSFPSTLLAGGFQPGRASDRSSPMFCRECEGKHIVMATMAIAVMFDLMDHFKAQEDVIVMFSLPSNGRGAAHALQ
jgi:hypothetical protein